MFFIKKLHIFSQTKLTAIKAKKLKTMKKITLSLLTFVLFTFASYAQLPPAGFYRLQVLGDFESQNVVVEPVNPGNTAQQPMNLNPIDMANANQGFELVYTGETFVLGDGSVVDVINLVSTTGSGNIEAARVTDGVRALTSTSGRANIRGGTTAGNEAGIYDNFYLEPTTPTDAGLPVFRIRIAHEETPGSNPNLRLVGSTSNDGPLFLNFGGFNSNQRDRFLFVEDPTLSTPTVSSSDFFVSNPVNDILTIKGLTSNLVSVSVYNVLGNQVSAVSANGKSLEINTASYAAGLYIVKIVSDNGTFSTKVVKI